ncbi:MAG TPA: hypothetical protein VMT81_02735, partial [Candidatus Paceibacterota bacterium]|nr:hypothetical protein [Candidatus Paceibacterota bacterium]
MSARINLNTVPVCPDERWVVAGHDKGGVFHWDPEEVRLHLPRRADARALLGAAIRKELAAAREEAFNANLLDWLFLRQSFIPWEWRRTGGYHRMVLF